MLHIARQDVLRVYGDLPGYKIILVQEEDGWHVDYDLTVPLVAGGGPHYVIDPRDGRILSKRYEQ